MLTIFTLLFLVSGISIVVGLIHPSVFEKIRIDTRKKVALVFGSLFIISLIGAGSLAPKEIEQRDVGKPVEQKQVVVEQKETTKKISLNNFLTYAKTSENGGFEMQPRKNDSHSYVGLSDDGLNGLELIENNNEVIKVIAYSVYHPSQGERASANSLFRLIEIQSFANEKDQTALGWIMEQVGNITKQPHGSDFTAGKDINGIHYKLTHNQDKQGFVKMTIEMTW